MENLEPMPWNAAFFVRLGDTKVARASVFEKFTLWAEEADVSLLALCINITINVFYKRVTHISE